ncbi:molybdate-anion transporter-like [Gossypium australe]|uniref:Molybdate-anion transporter-like n=2 Tax=Gossypium TaxID=3633 RepID=A0A5B6W3W8_9ROSI|nr:molybdate-anion transporter-like [Gossypium australe]
MNHRHLGYSTGHTGQPRSRHVYSSEKKTPSNGSNCRNNRVLHGFHPAAAMELFYFVVFGALGAVVAALELSKNSKDRINTSSAFNSFKNNYLVVYSLMMGN